MTFLSPVAFRAAKIPTTLTADVSVAFNDTRILEDIMPPANYWSWQRSFSKQQKACQQQQMTFLLTIAFRATKIQLALGLDIFVDRSFQSYQDPNNFKSFCRFQSYQNLERRSASCQLTGLTKKLFRDIKILSTVEIDSLVDHSFQSY